jgi:uncharacterized protein (DUF779 family)
VDQNSGVIIIIRSNWYFYEIVFHDNEDYVKDPNGLAYHRLFLVNVEAKICLGTVNGVFIFGDHNLSFWDYGQLFSDLVDDTTNFRYSFVRSGWKYTCAH